MGRRTGQAAGGGVHIHVGFRRERTEDAGKVQGAHDAGKMNALDAHILVGKEGELLLQGVVNVQAVRFFSL